MFYSNGECDFYVGYQDPDFNYKGYYWMSSHKGEMPAFYEQKSSTLERLVFLMRKVQPDLRKWKVKKH